MVGSYVQPSMSMSRKTRGRAAAAAAAILGRRDEWRQQPVIQVQVGVYSLYTVYSVGSYDGVGIPTQSIHADRVGHQALRTGGAPWHMGGYK